MKLGKLLGLGKSFFGSGESAAYRLNRRICLPKFNSEKNPFTPKPPAATPATPVAETKKFVPLPVRAPIFSPAPAAKPVRPGWTAKLNPFRVSEPAVEPPVVVQPEFSLKTVKVVHNDLADADIEIVPVKSRASVAPAVPVLAPARQAWEYLGESLLKSS